MEKLILSFHQGVHRDQTLGHQVWLQADLPTEPISGPKIHFAIARFQMLILMQQKSLNDRFKNNVLKVFFYPSLNLPPTQQSLHLYNKAKFSLWILKFTS